jgi:hypothetical protein
MPRKVFVAGEILTAADVNANLMDQAVQVFDDATDRTTQLPSPTQGMVTYLKDLNQVQAFDGSAYKPVGSVLQVVSTTKTDTFSSSATSFTPITGMTASITPSSTTSKVLVIVNIKGASTAGTANSTFHYQIVRGATPIAIGDSRGNRTRVTGNLGTRLLTTNTILSDTATFLDSPSIASSVTYSVEGRSDAAATWYVNRTEADVDNAFYFTSVSNVTLMEVAG